MPIIFTIGNTLQRYNIQQKELAIESNTRPATISQMCQNKVVRINSEMLNRVLPALERLTGVKHSLDDVMIYINVGEYKKLSNSNKQIEGNVSGIKYTLAETLSQYNLQQKDIVRETGIHRNIISLLCRNEIVRVNISMLERILEALETLTGEKHSLKDVMVYVHSDAE